VSVPCSIYSLSTHSITLLLSLSLFSLSPLSFIHAHIRRQFHQNFMQNLFILKCKELFSFTVWLCDFWLKNIGAKAVCKILMKLTTGPREKKRNRTFTTWTAVTLTSHFGGTNDKTSNDTFTSDRKEEERNILKTLIIFFREKLFKGRT